ncbi:MAG: pseudouridine synthase RluB [Actinomycetota bacterium]
MGNDAPGGATPEPPLWEQAVAEGERLQKVLSRVGFGSRRVCEELIADGRVTVNDEVAELGRRVNVESDQVCVDGLPIGVEPGLVYYLLNKPEGVVSTASDTHDRETVVDLVPGDVRVYPVGRLDMETSGLIILTNDGALTQLVTHPSRGVEKEYLAEVACGTDGVGHSALRRLRDGVELDDGITSPAEVGQPNPGVLRIVIHEGRNRQVRRMCEAVGHPVRRLVRVRIGPIRDSRLRPGEWRELTLDEVRELTASAAPRRGSSF